MQNGNRAPLGWDLRTVVFLVVTCVWTVSVLSDIAIQGFDVPVYVHGAMLGIVGYFAGDRLKRGN